MGTRYHTFTELAEEYGVDLSYVAKSVKEASVTVAQATKNGHACSAISSGDKEILEKKIPTLVVPLIKDTEVTVNDLAKDRGQEVSGLLKFLKAHEYGIEKRRRPEGGRAVNVLSSKEVARLTKEHPPKLKV